MENFIFWCSDEFLLAGRWISKSVISLKNVIKNKVLSLASKSLIWYHTWYFEIIIVTDITMLLQSAVWYLNLFEPLDIKDECQEEQYQRRI